MTCNRAVFLSLAIIVFLLLWWCIPVAIAHYFGNYTYAGAFGDIFGTVNALFSGLALFAVVGTLFLQLQELKSEREHRHRLEEDERTSIETAANTAKLQAVTSLASHYYRMMEDANANGNDDFASECRDETQTCIDRAVSLLGSMGERGFNNVRVLSRGQYAARRLNEIAEELQRKWDVVRQKDNTGVATKMFNEIFAKLQEWEASFETVSDKSKIMKAIDRLAIKPGDTYREYRREKSLKDWQNWMKDKSTHVASLLSAVRQFSEDHDDSSSKE